MLCGLVVLMVASKMLSSPFINFTLKITSSRQSEFPPTQIGVDKLP